MKNNVSQIRLNSIYESGIIIWCLLFINILIQKFLRGKTSFKTLAVIAAINLIFAGITISKASLKTHIALEKDVQNNFITNKQKLADNLLDMRTIPARLVSVKRIGNFEIGYQDEKDRTSNYDYPNNFSIGVLNSTESDYKYVVYVNGISPIAEHQYLKTIIEKFESDTTYVDVIIKENNQIRANIYRRTKENKPEFMMWKWINTNYKELDFNIEKLMNQHLFEK